MRTRLTRRRGAYAAEFAVVLPIFVMTLFAVIEFSRLLFCIATMEAAAREGGRVAVVRTADFTTADIQAKVTAQLAPIARQLRNVTIEVYKADPATGNPLDSSGAVTTIANADFTNAGFGEGIAVKITADFPGVAWQTWNRTPLRLVSTSVMYSEAN